MRIGFDARMIDHPGIGRYIRNLLSAMFSSKDTGMEFVLFGNPDRLGDFKGAPQVRIVRYAAPIYTASELYYGVFAKEKIDLLHVPHFNAPLINPARLVLTIHDLIYLKFPASAPLVKRMFAKMAIARAVKKSKIIIAVSEATKKDILGLFPDARGKIRVVYEAVDPVFRKLADSSAKEKVRQKYNLPQDIILCVGTLKRHKNIGRLIDAYIRARSKGLKDRLVIVGRHNPRETSVLSKIRSSDAVYLGEVPTPDLVALYNLGRLLVAPSLCEGFGLPVLEAMSCGLGVACSKVSAFLEIAGEAACYFDPLNSEEISEVICRLLADPALRGEMIKRGEENIKRFSWSKTASLTTDIYKEACLK